MLTLDLNHDSDFSIHYLQEAQKHTESGTQILVKDGTYRNEDYGSGRSSGWARFQILNLNHDSSDTALL